MVIVPNSKVKLIKNPLKLDSNNEMMFPTATAQYNYFTSLTKLEFDNLTYVRKDDVLRIPTDETGVGVTYEKLLQYNFCMYQNTHFGSKWFYAFIDDIKWINPSLTEVHLKTAYYQTWQFDLVFADSFIEREHVNDDTIGKHTIPEGVETGEYICSGFDYYNGFDTLYYMIQASEDYGTSTTTGTNYGGVFAAGNAYWADTFVHFLDILGLFESAGKSEAIYNAYMIPKNFIANIPENPTSYRWSGQNAPVSEYKTINKISSIDTYTPKNNKLLTFPYCYLMVSNNNGSSNIYHYERFYSQEYPNHCDFEIKGVPVVGGSFKLIPMDYDNGYDEECGLIAGKFPTLNWSEDSYTNWLTQNAVNLGVGVVSAGLQIVGGLATGNPTGIVSGGLAIASQMGQVYEHSLVQHSAKGNTNGGDINVCSGANGFWFYKMNIKKEYAQAIDGYFNMFGYKVNRVGTPHLHVRTYYDYIKTIDVNIEGNVPETDLEEIRKMFNNGIRFWHNTSYYLNFSVNNTIIS